MPGTVRLRHAVDHATAKRLVEVFGEATAPKKNTHPGLTKRVDIVSEQLCGMSLPTSIHHLELCYFVQFPHKPLHRIPIGFNLFPAQYQSFKHPNIHA